MTDLAQPENGGSSAASNLRFHLKAVSEFCKEFKEVIGMLALVVGAITWITAYFATKSEEQRLECFAAYSRDLIESESQERLTQDEIIRDSAILEDLDDKAKATPLADSEKQRKYRTKTELADAQTKHELAAKKSLDLRDRLNNPDCSVARPQSKREGS